MVCIYCAADSQVVNSRHQKRTNQVWRRRKCTTCHNIWSTIETVDYPQALTVQRDDGELEPFVREKLFISLYDSCKHRPKALEDARALTQTVISKLLPQIHNATLPRETVINTVSVVLKNFDHAAHVHYTAYHPL